MAAPLRKSVVKMFGGQVSKFTHMSAATKTEMTFSVFLPPHAKVEGAKVPVVYFLSGLTCTDDNFINKAGAQRAAAEHGVALVAPDTSPRGLDLEGEHENWDFGSGAGFYVNATESPWKGHYNMDLYVNEELPGLIRDHFPIDVTRASVMGHSMGGHGALVSALRNPGKYMSCSAFAPICNPMMCPWGDKAFTGYLGPDKSTWAAYDAVELSKTYAGPALSILADTGTADGFLEKKQLLPENLTEACAGNEKLSLTNRMQDGYDHSYFFIASFMSEHIAFHASHLK